MKNIEITIEEAEAIKSQLENTLPMAKIRNLVYFFEEKIRKAKEQQPEKKE